MHAREFIDNKARSDLSEMLCATCLIQLAPSSVCKTSANFSRGNFRPYADEFSSSYNLRITSASSSKRGLDFTII